MENEELKTWNRSDIVEILLEEFDCITDEDFPLFFTCVFWQYFNKIFNVYESEITTYPYIVKEGDVVGLDNDGDLLVKSELIRVDDMSKLSPDERVHMLTTFKLVFNNKNLMPRIGVLVGGYELKRYLACLLLERPEMIFDGVELPEIDIMLNIVADLANWNFDNEDKDVDDKDDDSGNELTT